MYEVANKLLEEAKECTRNFACLNPGTPPLCKVTDCINCEIHFILRETVYCPYFIYFGDELICKCPVRKELYNKYKV